jgi:GH25 family lysozyme M1 (1,4-beta-N-acetylmuramidase)
MNDNKIADLSFWDGQVDFTKMATKAKGVYYKASEGNWRDSKFTYNQSNSKGKLLNGCFHFTKWNVSPYEQAMFFWNTIKGDVGDFYPAIDWEWNYDSMGNQIPTPPNAIRILHDVCEYFKQISGLTKVAIYSSNAFINEALSVITNGADMQLFNNKQYWSTYFYWCASYGDTFPTANKMFGDVYLWQQTDRANGIEYGCESKGMDLNYMPDKYFSLFEKKEEPIKVYLPIVTVPISTEDDDMLKMKVMVDVLNVRALPTQNSKSLYQIKKDAVVDVYNVGSSGGYGAWVQISATESKWCCVEDANRKYLQKI